ncbi:Ig-like domain-containing protein, partial [Hydrotalea flava]|uniref:Ig-like domain-containing protein n=1 Tax=Hydrotalea flava TaxID=714549 RepID=UPI000A4F6C1E
TIVSAPITVNPLPTVQPINTGSGQVCAGSSLTVSDATPGGVWSSSNTSVATIDNSGKITAIAAGTTTITYTVTNGSGCTTSVSAPFTVNPLPTVQPINTGSGQVCAGSNLTVSDATPGGVWSSSNTSVASISASGVITAISAGTTTITYTV